MTYYICPKCGCEMKFISPARLWPKNAYRCTLCGYESKPIAEPIVKVPLPVEWMELEDIELTNGDMMSIFRQRYPNLNPIDFRPPAIDFGKGRKGMTVWLDNGDIILWFPKEGKR